MILLPDKSIGATDLSASVRGVQINGLNLGMALMRPGQPSAADQRSWLALRASADEVDLSGLGLASAGVSLNAKSLGVELNQGLGLLGGSDNLSVMDLAGARAITVATSAGAVALDFDARRGEVLQVVADVEMAVGSVLSVSGTVALSQVPVRNVALDNGQVQRMSGTLLAGENLAMRFGTATVALAASDVSFAMAMLKDTASGSAFLGLSVEAGQVELLGVPGVQLSGEGITVELNRGPGTGALAGRVVDFRASDVDGDGLTGTLIALRGANALPLTMNRPTLMAAGHLGLSLGEAGDEPALFAGSGDLRFEVLEGRMVAAGAGLSAAIAVAGQTAELIDGQMLLLLPDAGGYALSLDGHVRVPVPIPGADGLALMSEFSLGLNRSAAAVQETVSVNGQALVLNLALDATDVKFGRLDVTLDNVLGSKLYGVAGELVDLRTKMLSAEALPVIGKTVDELIGLSPVLSLGQYVQAYLHPAMQRLDKAADLPAPVYSHGSPTLRGLNDYLTANWHPGSGGGTALTVSLDEHGLSLDLAAAVSVDTDLALDFGAALGGSALSLSGKMNVSAQVDAGLDLGLQLDWTQGLKASFDLRRLDFAMDLAANELVLAATVGPLELSVGRAGAGFERASLSGRLSAGMTFVNGQLAFANPVSTVKANLPLYAELAGLDLSKPGAQPRLLLDADLFASEYQITTENFEDLVSFDKFSVEDLILALPSILEYLNSIDTSNTALARLPFIQQSVDDLLDVASVFKTQVVDRIDFNRPLQAWTPPEGASQLAAGTAATVEGSAVLTGVAGQFSAAMEGMWVRIDGRSLRITQIASDGASLTVDAAWRASQAQAAYEIHQPVEQIKTLQEFITAINASGVLGDQQASYDAANADLRLPIRFATELLGLQSQIDLGFDFG